MKNVINLLNDAKAIPYGRVRIYANARYTRKWGTCTYVGGNMYRIEIAGRLLQDDVSYEATMDTVIHELLHAYKNRMCHTGEWKRCANLVNKAYPQYNIKRCTSAAEKGFDDENYIKETVKYVVTCDTCGTKNYYKKKGKVVQYIMKYPNTHGCMCQKCGGRKFTVECLTDK